MVTVFWDCQGVGLADHLEEGKTITSAQYTSLTDRLKIDWQGKLSRFAHKVFKDHNALAYSSAIVIEKLIELGF